jgi:hypothetical protein
MRKSFVPMLYLFLIQVLSIPAFGNGLPHPSPPPDSGRSFFVFLHSVTNPDSIELRMDEPPDREGGYGTPLLSSGERVSGDSGWKGSPPNFPSSS